MLLWIMLHGERAADYDRRVRERLPGKTAGKAH